LEGIVNAIQCFVSWSFGDLWSDPDVPSTRRQSACKQHDAQKSSIDQFVVQPNEQPTKPSEHEKMTRNFFFCSGVSLSVSMLASFA